MGPKDVLFRQNAAPFRAYRMVLNSGRSYDIRHPELVRVMRTSVLVFAPTEDAGVYDHVEMLGTVLIDHIEPLDAPAAPNEESPAPVTPGGSVGE